MAAFARQGGAGHDLVCVGHLGCGQFTRLVAQRRRQRSPVCLSRHDAARWLGSGHTPGRRPWACLGRRIFPPGGSRTAGVDRWPTDRYTGHVVLGTAGAGHTNLPGGHAFHPEGALEQHPQDARTEPGAGAGSCDTDGP